MAIRKTYRGSRIKFALLLLIVLAITMSCIRNGSDGEAGTYAATKAAEEKALKQTQVGTVDKTDPVVSIYPAYPFSGSTAQPITVYTGTDDDLVGTGGTGNLGGLRAEDDDEGSNTDTGTGVGSSLQGPSNTGNTGGSNSNGNGSSNGSGGTGGNNSGGSGGTSTLTPGGRGNSGSGGFDIGADDEGLGVPGNTGSSGNRGTGSTGSGGNNGSGGNRNIPANPAGEAVVLDFVRSYTTYNAGTTSAEQFAANVKGVSEDTRREILQQAKANWPRLAQDKVVSTGTVEGAPKRMSETVWQVVVKVDERGTKTSKQRTVTYTITTTQQGGKELVHSVTG